MSAPAKRRYVLAASDAPASASGAADAVNALCVALYRAESERDELVRQLAATRAELAEARGSRLSSVLAGCCAFIEQRDAARAEVAALTAEVAPLRELRARYGGRRVVDVFGESDGNGWRRLERYVDACLRNPNDTEDGGAYGVTP